MLGVVLCVGVPAGWRLEFLDQWWRVRVHVRNQTAIALVASWSIGEAGWLLTGDNLPLKLYIITDYMVMVTIFLKTGLPDFPAVGRQGGRLHRLSAWMAATFRTIWWALSSADRAIMSIFGLMWITYAAAIGDYYRYWILWVLVVLQFGAAGTEAFASWRRGRARADLHYPTDIFPRWGLAGHEW